MKNVRAILGFCFVALFGNYAHSTKQGNSFVTAKNVYKGSTYSYLKKGDSRLTEEQMPLVYACCDARVADVLAWSDWKKSWGSNGELAALKRAKKCAKAYARCVKDLIALGVCCVCQEQLTGPVIEILLVQMRTYLIDGIDCLNKRKELLES